MKTLARLSLILCLLLFTGAWAQESAQQQADAEMVKARELLRQGHFDSAVVKYQDAFKIAPDYPAPYEELGKLMLEKENLAYAIQMYSKLVELRPRNKDYLTVLFSLTDGYNMFDEALATGEKLLEIGEADPETLKRMIQLCREVGKPLEQARLMEIYAVETDADADYWAEIASSWLEQSKTTKAEDAVKVAIEKDPDNPKYQNLLARIYAGQNRLSEAEEIFQKISEESPEDQGVKDELAQLYVQQGDAYLVRGRANTALKYYDLAESTGKAADNDEEPSVPAGFYEGTVNTTDQVFATNANSPGVGVGSYRRGATGFTGLGNTLGERRESAEMLLSPQYLFDGDFGHNDVNTYTLIDNVVRVPIRGTELDLRVRHSFRDVSSFAGSASREYVYAGFNYNWNKDWSTQAYVGTNGLYDLRTFYEGDRFRGGVLIQRDIWNFTPRALGNDLYFNRQGFLGGVSIVDRLSLDGQIDFYQFNDGIDQTIYSIGPTYQVLLEPGVQELAVSYQYSGQTNTQELDPIVRFSPRALNAHSIGFDYNRILNDWWRVRGGYYYTWANDGSSAGTWNVGSDFQVWKGAVLGINYERGAFGQGVIGPGLQGIQSRNDNLNVNFGVSF